MKNLTLADLSLGVPELLEKRVEFLHLVDPRGAIEKQLRAQVERLLELPAAARRNRPLAEALGLTDDLHDGSGSGVFYYLQAYLVCPLVPAEIRAAAARIRGGFIPVLDELRATYADEASRAKDRASKLEPFRADLEQFPIAGGGTLFDWVKSFLDAGIKLDGLLAQRSDEAASAAGGGRQAAAGLRGSLIGLLGRLRDRVRDELKTDPALPRDLEAKLFSYVDQLAASRG